MERGERNLPSRQYDWREASKTRINFMPGHKAGCAIGKGHPGPQDKASAMTRGLRVFADFDYNLPQGSPEVARPTSQPLDATVFAASLRAVAKGRDLPIAAALILKSLSLC